MEKEIEAALEVYIKNMLQVERAFMRLNKAEQLGPNMTFDRFMKLCAANGVELTATTPPQVTDSKT